MVMNTKEQGEKYKNGAESICYAPGGVILNVCDLSFFGCVLRSILLTFYCFGFLMPGVMISESSDVNQQQLSAS